MPPIAKRFHRSMYLTLGLACACLGYAELDFLPEISAFAAIVLVLLIVAYRLEGRWSLSIRAANVLGGAIAAVTIVWVTYQLLRPDALFEQLPSPTWMLPYLGPLLMILVPAKLFRPKHNGDFWGLHGIGLIAVALGCALTGDPIFGVLLIGYFLSCVWSLTLFYYYRLAEPICGNRQPTASPRVFAQAGRWVAGVTGLALILFLSTPRVTDTRWDLPGYTTHMLTGVDDNHPVIDLNRTGTLTVSREKVFEVHAFTKDCPDPPPKLDLDPGQRWRKSTLNYYGRGKWEHRDPGPRGRFSEPRDVTGNATSEMKLPDLGPDPFYLEFHLSHPAIASHIFADPVAIGPKGERRHSDLPRGLGISRFPWPGQPADDNSAPPFMARSVYDQVVFTPKEPGVSSPVRLDEVYVENLRNSRQVPQIAAWSRQVMQTLVEQGRLPRAVLGKRESVPYFPACAQNLAVQLLVSGGWLPETVLAERVPPRYYEAVCRAFEAYLARSGHFQYSMTLTREDDSIDPIEDFVLNSRKGHCERFATALALMLRSVGVPTRIVMGFRGHEPAGNGLYEVLQCHAHSWVEALIYRPPPSQTLPAGGEGQGGGSPWRWLTLDPTPTSEDAVDRTFTWSNWWEYTSQGATVFFRNFIVEYDADQQERTRYAMSQSQWWAIPHSLRAFFFGPGGDNWLLATLILMVGLAMVLAARTLMRRTRRPERPDEGLTPFFYGRLLDTLKRGLGIWPGTGETAGEFAVAAAHRLGADPQTHAVAGVPAATAEIYYRVRFGDRPLTEDQRHGLDARLSALESAFK